MFLLEHKNGKQDIVEIHVHSRACANRVNSSLARRDISREANLLWCLILQRPLVYRAENLTQAARDLEQQVLLKEELVANGSLSVQSALQQGLRNMRPLEEVTVSYEGASSRGSSLFLCPSRGEKLADDLLTWSFLSPQLWQRTNNARTLTLSSISSGEAVLAEAKALLASIEGKETRHLKHISHFLILTFLQRAQDSVHR